MSEKSLINSDMYQNLVYFNLKTICAVSSHGLTVHQIQHPTSLICKIQEDLIKLYELC